MEKSLSCIRIYRSILQKIETKIISISLHAYHSDNNVKGGTKSFMNRVAKKELTKKKALTTRNKVTQGYRADVFTRIPVKTCL